MFERVSTRGFIGLAALWCALLFATAVAPAPSPTPARSPTAAPPSALPSPTHTPPMGIEQLPTVLVYPFDVQTGADPRIGIAIGQILGQEMVAAGGINVLPIPQGIKRTDFLENARTNHADFYISGYVTPVGETAAVVEQVVSVESGVILFSQTAQVSSVADVASQSLLARSQILAFVGRNTETMQTQSSNTPAPTSTNGAQMPIQGLGSIVNSVFKHSKGGTHTPMPAPVVKPDRGIIVAPVAPTGPLASSDVTNATHELYFALNARYNAQMTTVTTAVAQSADAICGLNRNNTIATGTLAQAPAPHNKVLVTFALRVYTCFGAALDSETASGSTIKAAVDAAVAAYATAHPDNS